MFIVDTLITIFATVAAWNALAKGWGNSSTLAPLDWPFGGLPFLSGLGTLPRPALHHNAEHTSCCLVATTVHLFFCWRIWILRSTVILPVGIALVRCHSSRSPSLLIHIADRFLSYHGPRPLIVASMSVISSTICVVYLWNSWPT